MFQRNVTRMETLCNKYRLFFLQVVGSLVGHTSSIECIGISSRYSYVNVVAPASAFMHITSLLYLSACPEKQNVGCVISVGKWLYVWIV